MLTERQSQDYNEVKRAIQACYKGLSVFQIEPVHGHENYTYYVNDKLVVRFFKSEFIEKEASQQQKILEFIAPQLPFHIGIFSTYYAEWDGAPLVMSVSPRINGYALENDKFSALPQHAKKYIFDQLSEFMHALHTIDVDEARRHQIPTLDKQLSRRLKSMKLIVPVLLAGKHIIEKGQCVSHNDLHPRNFHIDGSYKIKGVFDFDTLSIGSPIWDVAISYYNLKDVQTLSNSYTQVSGCELNYVMTAYYFRAFVERACALQRSISKIQREKLTPNMIVCERGMNKFLFQMYQQINKRSREK